MLPSVMPVVISYNSHLWIKVALKSFRRFFPNSPILIIDNNLDPGMPGYDSRVQIEKKWIRDWCAQDCHCHFVKANSSNRGHGVGMDCAAAWCRANGIRWMIHIEPDCIIDGVEWSNKLLEAAAKNVWMAGSHRKGYGPIHPTPSIWDMTKINSSFRTQPRGSDMNHPRFNELMNMEFLREGTIGYGWENYWSSHWDTAQKPWFDAAVHDKTLLVAETPDFKHFWYGSSTNPDPNKTGDPRVAQYL